MSTLLAQMKCGRCERTFEVEEQLAALCEYHGFTLNCDDCLIEEARAFGLRVQERDATRELVAQRRQSGKVGSFPVA